MNWVQAGSACDIGVLRREACLIDGEWVTGTHWLGVDDPATGAQIGRVPAFGADETEAAVQAAQRAFPTWSRRTALSRSDVLEKLHSLMSEHRDALARLLSWEQGKPFKEARGEIDYAASYVKWFAAEAHRLYGDLIPADHEDKRIIVVRQPIGVVAAITPWNFPAAMITRKIAPALAAGCTVVLKPAEQTPFTALAIGYLAVEAGIPAGVLNIVTGDPVEIGRILTGSPIVRKLSFTGSTQTGAKLMAQCAPTVKKLSLELGGNAPFIVFDDADIEAAVEGAVLSKYRNAGQTCVCANRFYVQTDVYDEFVSRLAERSRLLQCGPASDPLAAIGPLIDGKAIAKVERHVRDAVSRGARVLSGGQRHPAGSNFFMPTVIADVPADALVAQEETFGPVAAVIRFETEAEVIDLANATPFGLAAYLYTRSLSKAWRVSESLESGMVGLNTGLISTASAPFGGVKTSGLGREGSRYGMDDYVEMKYICMDVG